MKMFSLQDLYQAVVRNALIEILLFRKEVLEVDVTTVSITLTKMPNL